MEDYNALTSTTSSEDSVEHSHSLAKDTHPEPKSSPKSSKRDKRGGTNSSAVPKSDLSAKLPVSLDPLTGDYNVLSNRPKLLARFLEVRELRAAPEGC